MAAGYLRLALCVVLAAASLPLPGQTYDETAVRMFKTLSSQPNLLAKYLYLEKASAQLSPANRLLAQQMRCFAQAELGLYDQAVKGFPLKMQAIPGLAIPDPSQWRAADAATVVADLAAQRRIVLINEVHHNAHTRLLTLQLLPRLKALGFRYLALEALGSDPGLASRGYPLRSSGTEYLQEPLYGEIAREALRLGFVLVPYDYEQATSSVETREAGQAQNLFDRVFAHDPNARLVVAAGYAHIDKATGRLGAARPMAMALEKLTGIEPLSIDQAQFIQAGDDPGDDYHQLQARFPATSSEVLLDRQTGKPWTAAPKLYDVSVIAPPASPTQAFEEDLAGPSEGRFRYVSSGMRLAGQSFVAFTEIQRPQWLDLGGERRAYPVSTRLCRNLVPCVVEAHYAAEGDDAVPADIYAFFKTMSSTKLYLEPGRYRLRAWNAAGTTLSQTDIVVAAH